MAKGLEKLLILGALGFGAYYLATKMGGGVTVIPTNEPLTTVPTTSLITVASGQPNAPALQLKPSLTGLGGPWGQWTRPVNDNWSYDVPKVASHPSVTAPLNLSPTSNEGVIQSPVFSAAWPDAKQNAVINPGSPDPSAYPNYNAWYNDYVKWWQARGYNNLFRYPGISIAKLSSMRWAGAHPQSRALSSGGYNPLSL